MFTIGAPPRPIFISQRTAPATVYEDPTPCMASTSPALRDLPVSIVVMVSSGTLYITQAWKS
jgi:hypothetical protein